MFNSGQYNTEEYNDSNGPTFPTRVLSNFAKTSTRIIAWKPYGTVTDEDSGTQFPP